MSTPGRHFAQRVSDAWQAISQINTSVDVTVILKRLVSAGMKLIEAQGGSAGRMEDGRLVFREYNDRGKTLPIDLSFASGEGIPGWVLQTRLPYYTNDPLHDPHATPEIVRDMGYYNLVVVPIIGSDQEFFGVFAIHNTEGRRPINDEDVSVLLGIASIAAVAIQNAEMVQQVRRSEANLRASENSFRLAFAANPVPMMIWDLDTKVVIEANQAAIEKYGYTRDEFIGMSITALQPEGDRDESVRLMNLREPYRGIRRHKLKDGSIIIVDVAAEIIEFEGRQAKLSVAKDITESVIVQQRLLLQNHVTQLLAQSPDLDSAAQGIIRAFCLDMHWATGVICLPDKRGNIRCKYHWPVDSAEVRLCDLSDDGVGCACAAACASAKPVWIDFQQPHHSNACLDAAAEAGFKTALAVPISLQGDTLGVMAFFSSETRRQDERLSALAMQVGSEFSQFVKRAHAEEQHALLTRAVEQTGESIVITDARGQILYVNPAFERISGYRSEEVIGRNPRVLKSGQQPPEFYQELWAKLNRGETWTGKFMNRNKAGGLFEEEAAISPVRDSSGRVINYVAVKRDVSAERLLQEQLRQSQKMEAIGKLAGGVAHDFNNVLGVILGYSELLLERTPSTDRSYKAIEEIHTAAERAAGLTRQLLAFSRKQVLEPRLLDLNVVVGDLGKMLQRLIGESIELMILPGAGIGAVKADPGQIEQVIINLAVNARDAMPEGGTLVIETSEVAIAEDDSEHEVSVPPGRYVLLTISDSGCGMTPEVKERIFEPFFTTKEAGKGTGLGLSTVYGIIRQSGGYVFVDSTAGKGTVFNVYLPRVEGKVKPEPSPEPTGTYARGAETLLLAEDEGAARGLIARQLRDQSYTVLEACNGLEALKISQEHKGNIDLLITDMVMPKMGGRELATILRETHPKIKVLFISGYSEDHAQIQAGDPNTELLQKPFHMRDLNLKMRSMLDGGKQSPPKK